MNYRVNDTNLTRPEIKAIKRDDALKRNAKYQKLSLTEKIAQQTFFNGKQFNKLCKLEAKWSHNIKNEL